VGLLANPGSLIQPHQLLSDGSLIAAEAGGHFLKGAIIAK
jgi:hypothetical protein